MRAQWHSVVTRSRDASTASQAGLIPRRCLLGVGAPGGVGEDSESKQSSVTVGTRTGKAQGGGLQVRALSGAGAAGRWRGVCPWNPRPPHSELLACSEHPPPCRRPFLLPAASPPPPASKRVPKGFHLWA